MFSSIKRLISAGPAKGDDSRVMSAWAAAEGHSFKTVRDKVGGGVVVHAKDQSWRMEWGSSQRTYIPGKELRFLAETALPHDVQILVISRVLAHTLETEVYSRFTNAMQTQVDTSLPDEMRWLPMHPRVSLAQPAVFAKRFVVLSNAEAVARRWLSEDLLASFEEAASTWWTDSLVMVMTVNRGRLAIRMPGQPIEIAQLKALGHLISQAAASLQQASAHKA